MQSNVVKYFNANPWNKYIPDCAIRAVVMAIGMKYELVCKAFGVAWKRGRGLVRDTGISLDDIKSTFSGYFGNVVDFNEEIPPELAEDPDFIDTMKMDAELGVSEQTSGLTLAEFIDLYDEQGWFLVGLVGNQEAENKAVSNRDDGHIVCVRCVPGKAGYAIDTFDSSEMIVDSYMHVVKGVPKSDPRHYVYDSEHHCFAGYGMEKQV